MQLSMRALLACLIVGCSGGDVPTNGIPCGPNGSCPSGYACQPRTNLCVLEAAIAPPDAGVPDAPLGPDAPSAPDAPPPPDAPGRPDAGAPDAGPPPDALPAPAELSLRPEAQDFGVVTIGDQSLPLLFTVTNAGGLASAPLSASAGGDFTVVGGSCLDAPLAGGSSCSVHVLFQPTGDAGPRSAVLAVGAGADARLTAALSGTAITPGQVTVTPSSFQFAATEIGARSAEAPFTIRNVGEAPIAALDATLSGGDGFAISSNQCTATLAAGASCTVGVTFAPGAVGLAQGVSLAITATPGGSAAATLQGPGTARLEVANVGGGTVTSSPEGIDCGATCGADFTDADVTLRATPDGSHAFGGWSGGGCSGHGPCIVHLAASASVAARFLRHAALSLTPANADLGEVTVGDRSAAATFTVTNGGEVPSGALVVTVDDPSYVVAGGTCPGATLAGGASCTVLVQLAPTGAAGARPARLSAAASPEGTATAALTGTAFSSATLSLTPASADLGAAPLGGTGAPTTFTLQNLGQSPAGAPNASLSDAADFAITAIDCPAMLAAGASCHVTVALAPATVGAVRSTLAIAATPGARSPRR